MTDCQRKARQNRLDRERHPVAPPVRKARIFCDVYNKNGQKDVTKKVYIQQRPPVDGGMT